MLNAHALRGLNILATARDASLGLLLFVTIVLMVLPLPTLLVDIFIGINFAVAIMILMTAVYLKQTLDLSSLPGIILVSTLFRLSLSVTTTRLILAEGDAGEIIETFGEFVISGNVVVGLVVFFIITVVQFLVIAKGSERIAEVAARFTLDAMPGKQMAIDAELRSGDIDAEEAGRRRDVLGRESQFFGAMDGAMKFVKGDAIAGLIIIFVNLIAGFTIGVAQLGLSAGESMQKYALLSVGDALISQIPALLLSLAAASTVTRVQGKKRSNMAAEIFSQIGAEPRGIQFAALGMVGLSIIPGFPTVILLSIAAVLFLIGRQLQKNADDMEASAGEVGDAESDVGDQPVELLPKYGDFQIEAAETLRIAIQEEGLARYVGSLRKQIAMTYGVGIPPVGFRFVSKAQNSVMMALEDVPFDWHDISPSDVEFALTVEKARDFLGPDHEIREARYGALVGLETTEALAASGAPFLTPQKRVEVAIEQTLVRALPEFIGIQEAKDFLSEVQGSHGALVDEVMQNLSIPAIAEILQTLLSERVPLLPRRVLLEAMAKYGGRDATPADVVERIRVALKLQISHKLSTKEREIPVLLVPHDIADLLRQNLHQTPEGLSLIVPPSQGKNLVEFVEHHVLLARHENRKPPAVLASIDVRRYLAAYFRRKRVSIDVISDSEVAEEYVVNPLAEISLGPSKL